MVRLHKSVLPTGSAPWVVALSLLTGVTALSIDMSLPAQPSIARQFGVTSDVAQLTLSLFLVGFASAQLVFGTLSDAFGRRRVLLAGLGVFTLAGIACAASPAIGVLLVARFAQGVGASAAPVIARAMVRDTQETAAAARTLSTVMAVLAVAPMVAPSIGAVLLAHFGWAAIFVTLVCLGVVLALITATGLSETLPPERRTALSFAAVRVGFARYFGNRSTHVPTALVCLAFGGQFAFISSSPFLLIEGFGISPQHYGLYFALTALALMSGSILGRRLLTRWSPRRVLRLGAFVLCGGGLLVFAGVRVPEFGVAGLIAPMLVYFVGVGLTLPSAIAVAMEQVADIAGFASAVIGSLQMFSGAIAGYVTTKLGAHDPSTLATVVATVGLASLLLASTQARRR
jgi:DHA1 family bicyclomycin/chloramphenicol resistance-like MFS transporter